MKATPVAEVSPRLPKTIACTLTAVPQSSGIRCSLRYVLARSLSQDLKTAPIAPQSCSRGSSGKSRPVSLRTTASFFVDDVGQVLRRQVRVRGNAARLLPGRQDLLEVVPRHAQNDVGVHLDETAPAVEGETLAEQSSETRQRLRRQAEVQDRVHHARHRGARPGTHRNEQRVPGVPEALARRLLDARQRRVHLGPHAVERLSPRVVVAHGRVDRESGRNRDPEGGHLGQARPLASQGLLAESRALRDTVAEEIDLLHFSTTISEKSASRENSFWIAPSSARRFCRSSGSGQLTRTSTKKRSSDGAMEAIVSMAAR